MSHRRAIKPNCTLSLLTVIFSALFLAMSARADRPIGIDVSHWQGVNVNWNSLKNDYNISFAWCKATEATGYVDDTFATNMFKAKAAGIPIGGYHYARYDLNPGAAGAILEANHFWAVTQNYIKGGGFYLMPMLDIEADFTGQTKDTISTWVNQWCTTVSNSAAAVGVIIKPCIYTSSSKAAAYMDSTVTKWNIDIAQWYSDHTTAAAKAQTGTPSISPWTTWQTWQYDDQNVAQAITTGDGDIFNGTAAQLVATLVIGGGNSSSVASSTIPSLVRVGQTFTATIVMNNSGTTTWTNNGANPFRLGSQSPQDNSTWGLGRVNMPTSPVAPGQNATFTFTATAPTNAGAYVFSWKMVQEGVAWFGQTFSTFVSVGLGGPGTNYGSYIINSGNMDSTSRNAAYAAFTSCGTNAWYSYGIPLVGSNCSVFNRDIRWIPPTVSPYPFSGRGYLTASTLVPSTQSKATANYFAVDNSGADVSGVTGSVNECAYSCNWVNFFTGAVNFTNSGGFSGFRSNTQNDSAPGAGGCTASCGGFTVGYSQMNIQGARWNYIDDWTCLGSYASTSVSDTANRSFTEANLYLYPAVDTSHGNTIGTNLGLNGRVPGHVLTGDCNSTNTLNFGGAVNGVSPAGNAATYGNTENSDAYGFAWVFAPAGAAPLFTLASDDGNRLWVNGVLKNDTNAARGLILDQDVTAAVTLAAGWNRVLFKVHNFTAGFQGTVSLRNGGNVNLNEPSVNYYDLGGYFSYGLGYEQDEWYPQVTVTSFENTTNLVNGQTFYTNNTLVSVSGKSNGQGPVPLWRTMQYQWGYGLNNADGNYTDVSGTPTAATWTHLATGVTGHRRFNFFAVSKSGRTSFQNSGLNGGSLYQDAGNYARYFDVFVDNIAPQPPAFSSASSSATNQINLAWDLPLDQGVNIVPGSDESAGAAGNQNAQNWYRVGDVGVQVYRDGNLISDWTNNIFFGDTGLVANTAYTYTLNARDNTSGGRGPWSNTTGQRNARTAWTLSVPPTLTSILTGSATNSVGTNIAWTVSQPFGPGQVQYYRYSWDTAATHVWSGTETQWTNGVLITTPVSAGAWYLHVKGFNGEDVENGTFDYAVTAAAVASTSQTNKVGAIADNHDGTFTITLIGMPQAQYCLIGQTDMTATNWTPVPGSTNTVADPNGLWTVTVTNNTNQRYYRSMLLTPAP